MKSGYAKRFTAAGMALALACGTAGVLSLSACGAASDTPADSQSIAEQEAVAPESYTFTDDMGNEVTVNDPQRVVACMGSFANTWELAGGTLVGVSDDAFTFDNFDIASPDVQSVGDFTSLNLEAIIALEPDFVIMTSGTGGRGGDCPPRIRFHQVTDLPDRITPKVIRPDPTVQGNRIQFPDQIRQGYRLIFASSSFSCTSSLWFSVKKPLTIRMSIITSAYSVICVPPSSTY